MLRSVDAAAPNPNEVALADAIAENVASRSADGAPLPSDLLLEFWKVSDADICGLTVEEFARVLSAVGAKHNYGLPHGEQPNNKQREGFVRALHLREFALAHACALGRGAAWEQFLRLYRTMLTQAAIAITRSASLGEELADSLYAELYGLRDNGGGRRSPFASYSGRGSLQGWLRATLVQRFRDRYRRTYRENPLDEVDPAAPENAASISADTGLLERAVARTLGLLATDDRFMLSAYYLDRWTLQQIARTIEVHEATISRRLKRLVAELRKQLVANLRREGLSEHAAEEALGADPRDLEINLRALMQTSQGTPFQEKTASARTEESESA
jgi:RNA polymerase sigma-70 factor, ECF subfamily